jgi:hypothetical protein
MGMNRLASLLVAPLLLVSAAQAAPLSNTTVRFSNPSAPFSVNLPSGWVGVKFNDGLGGVNIASRPKAPAALMRFTFLPKQGKVVNLNTEFLGFEQAVRQGGTTIKLVSSKAARYGGVNGLIHVYDLSQKGKNLRSQLWFGSGKKNFYNFQLTDARTTYDKNAPLFAAALKSVAFK